MKFSSPLTISFLVFILLSGFQARAQEYSIGGTVISKSDSLPLIGANVLLIHLPDSTQQGMATNVNGFFGFKNLSPGTYLLQISYTGYQTIQKEIEFKGRPIGLKKIILTEGQELVEFVVEAKIPIATQNGDTTSYNAGAFKVNPDATAEDLINKMPGVTTNDGKIQVQGENVGKILVDGKPYMGDDPKAALKNLPADAIGKIQVFDQKSEQAQFTGIDDGNTTKTINIITKPEFRNGNYGKIFGGYGTDNRYKAGATYNSIKNNRRITLLGQSNSINEQNFSNDDLGGIISSSASSGGPQRGGGRGGPGGWNSAAGNFMVDQLNGITTSHAFGFNFTNAWANKSDITISYFYNLSDNKTLGSLYRQYVSPRDSGLIYDEGNSKISRNSNHRINMRYNWIIDTMRSMLITPKFTLQNNSGTDEFSGNNTQSDFLISNLSNLSNSSFLGFNLSIPVLYKQKLKKTGRTFSLEVNPGYNYNKGDQLLKSTSNFYSDNTLLIVDQNSLLNQNTISWSSNLSYTEAIGKYGIGEFNYSTNYNQNDSQRETFLYNTSASDYNYIDTALSNIFVSDYFSNKFGLTYRYNQDKISVSVGTAYQIASLNNNQEFPFVNNLKKDFHNVLPNAMLMMRFSKTKNLRINYSTSNNVPSVSQLQDVINNTNPLQLNKGNSDLKQDYRHGLFARYSSSNVEKSTTFFAMIGGSYNTNYISKSTFIADQDTLLQQDILLQKGSQLVTYTNLDHYFSLRSFVNYSFPIKKIKSNLNLGISGNFSQTPGLINETLNYAHSSNASFTASLVSNISEKIDFTISGRTTINSIKNSLQSSLNSTYYNHSSRVSLIVNPWKGLFMQGDVMHQYNGGLSSGFNNNFILLGGSLAYKFLKNKAADLRVSVFDALQQNTSVKRNTTDVYIEDSFNNILQRYYMLTFTYTFRNFKEVSPKPSEKN